MSKKTISFDLGTGGNKAYLYDMKGNLLRDETPIWSDVRAQIETMEFFKTVDSDEWYLTTGNGFPAACYTIFKVMWYRNNAADIFKHVYKILGTKDYINYRL